jgi:hypothetical protein
MTPEEQRAILAAAMKAGSALPRSHHSDRRRAGVPRLSGPASLSGAPETTRRSAFARDASRTS